MLNDSMFALGVLLASVEIPQPRLKIFSSPDKTLEKKLLEQVDLDRLIEDFHVTSYQADFASHPILVTAMLVSFALPAIGKYNKMSGYFLFSSYHNTKLRPCDKNSKT